jgi:CheY-like chemotaxis protein
MSEDKRKVMLIDDNIISLMVTAEVLTTHGYAVAKTASAKGCVAKLEYELPDVVLVDPSMPQLGIDRLVEAINADDLGKDIAIVLFSDRPIQELEETCKSKNMNGYFSKSIEVTRLPEFIDVFF